MTVFKKKINIKLLEFRKVVVKHHRLQICMLVVQIG